MWGELARGAYLETGAQQRLKEWICQTSGKGFEEGAEVKNKEGRREGVEEEGFL